jgi:hypothetical protein
MSPRTRMVSAQFRNLRLEWRPVRWFEELLRVLSLILCHALLAAPLHPTGAAKLSSRPTNNGRPAVLTP